MENIVRIIIYIVSFCVSMYALNAIHYERFLRKNKVLQAQILYLLMALALAYLVAEFILGLYVF